MTAGLLLLASGVGAGIFGSLLGLGGGVLLVPLLTLGFGRPLRESVAVALVCVIVTSTAAASVYLQNRVANLRLGLYLALFTALGSLAGGLIAFLIEERFLAGLFAALLAYVALSMARAGLRTPSPAATAATVAPDTASAEAIDAATDPDAADGATAAPSSPARPPAPAASGGSPSLTDRLSGTDYRVRHLVPGGAASVGSGMMSALLGVGGGIINVPVMHLLMGAPLRVAAATSNLMVGVTAIASAVIYLARGEIDPFIAGPLALGVFVGATLGSRNAHRVDLRIIRWLFVAVMAYTAFQMGLRAVQG